MKDNVNLDRACFGITPEAWPRLHTRNLASQLPKNCQADTLLLHDAPTTSPPHWLMGKCLSATLRTRSRLLVVLGGGCWHSSGTVCALYRPLSASASRSCSSTYLHDAKLGCVSALCVTGTAVSCHWRTQTSTPFVHGGAERHR